MTYFTCEGTQNSHSMSQRETNLVFAEANRGSSEGVEVVMWQWVLPLASQLVIFDTHAKLPRFHPCPAFSAKFFKCCLIVCKFQSPQNHEHIRHYTNQKFTHRRELIDRDT